MNPVRWSNLKWMAESPAHYRYNLDNPVQPTPAMRFGSLVHGILLGFQYGKPAVFDGERRGKAWTEFKEQFSSVEIVTVDEWDGAMACADAVRWNPVCGHMIDAGAKEHRITWDIAGRPCSGTPDVHGDILLDLKVTPYTNPARIAWHVRKMMWHAQLAWYKHGIEANGGSVSDVYLVCVTPKPPYLPVAYWLKPESIDAGTKQWRLLFERLLVCEASNEWPGYAQDVLPLGIDDDESLTLSIAGEEVEI